MSRDTPIEVLFLNTPSNDIVFTHDIELFQWLGLRDLMFVVVSCIALI